MSVIPVITIDGPSGAGKGTVCQLLAKKLGFHLLDSGVLYRLTAFACAKQGIDLHNPHAVTHVASGLDVDFKPDENGITILLDGQNVTKAMRQEAVGMGASVIAGHAAVRKALLACQRNFERQPGLVADGRDMGTVVFPHALVKVFLTASAEKRAERRYNQLLESGVSASIDAVLSDIKARDTNDVERSVSPLAAAVDALAIDSTSMSVGQVFDTILAVVNSRTTV